VLETLTLMLELSLMSSLPSELHWLFWDVDPNAIDVEAGADTVLARVLERGRLVDVRSVIGIYGLERIHRFFRTVGHPAMSQRTLDFWRALFHAEDEPWASPPAWRTTIAAPWID
jgi:hypothetical protein